MPGGGAPAQESFRRDRPLGPLVLYSRSWTNHINVDLTGMKLKRRIDELRAQALALLREDQALSFVISPPDLAGRERADLVRARILQGNKKGVLNYIAKVREHMRERRRDYGVKARPQELLSFFEDAEKAPPGDLVWAPIFFVRSLFRDYTKVMPGSDALPAHARLAFDAHCLGGGGEPIQRIRLLEATVYEDMATLCNLAIAQSRIASGTTARLPLKTMNALCRATIAASVGLHRSLSQRSCG